MSDVVISYTVFFQTRCYKFDVLAVHSAISNVWCLSTRSQCFRPPNSVFCTTPHSVYGTSFIPQHVRWHS